MPDGLQNRDGTGTWTQAASLAGAPRPSEDEKIGNVERPWSQPGPLRNAFYFSILISILALVMAADSIGLPLPGDQYAAFNRISAWSTGILLVIAGSSVLCIKVGWTQFGRFLIVIYGCGLVGTMGTILGGGSGIDLIGATCLIFGPALIFSRTERIQIAVAGLLALATIVFVEYRVHFGPGPIIALDPQFMAEIRIGAVIVAACVGVLIIYLYWSAELSRAIAASEHERSEELLLNVLPKAIAERLKSGEREIADTHREVTILFADIVGFTKFASAHSATEVVGLLNRIFSQFDDLCIAHKVEKLKTIGDGYMAVAGAPTGYAGHQEAAARLALHMQEVVREIQKEQPEIGLRVGLNTGSAIAGVMGSHKFAYDIWGDAVNVASRMESKAVPGTVAVSTGVRDALAERFDLESMGMLELKGKGAVEVWHLIGPKTGGPLTPT
jgi:adenylate cyclase